MAETFLSDTQTLKEKIFSSTPLTLEDIRTGLGLPINESNPNDQVPATEPTVEQLFLLAQELIEFVGLLDEERQALVKECTEKNHIVQKFEALYDSLRERETQFYDKMRTQEEKFDTCSCKFNSLNNKVLTHLEELQEERDTLASEACSLENKIQTLHTCSDDLKKRIQDQKESIALLRRGPHNLFSEKEVTDLSLRFRSLQNYNAQLLTDFTVLKLKHQELSSFLERVACNVSCNVLNRVSLDQSSDFDLKLSGHNTLGDSYGPSSHNTEVLEKAIEQLKLSIVAQEEDYNKKIKELQDERTVYERYKEALESMIERGELKRSQ